MYHVQVYTYVNVPAQPAVDNSNDSTAICDIRQYTQYSTVHSKYQTSRKGKAAYKEN